MSTGTAQWRLALLWLAGGGLVFLVLVVQSFTGFYLDRTADAWSWFLPAVMPTLSLIVGVLVAQARDPEEAPERPVRGRVFGLAAGLSALYLSLVAAAVVVAALAGSRETPPLELMHRSNLWLGPLQGLVAGTLGVFFHQQRAS